MKMGGLITGVVSWLAFAGLRSKTFGQELNDKEYWDNPEARALIKTGKQI